MCHCIAAVRVTHVLIIQYKIMKVKTNDACGDVDKIIMAWAKVYVWLCGYGGDTKGAG